MTLEGILPVGIRSHLLGAIGVLAVCGLVSTGIAYVHIRQQNKTIEAQSGRIGELVTINKGWAESFRKQQLVIEAGQQSTEALQSQLETIESQSADMAQQIKALEASNAQIREYMSRPIPHELRMLLDKK